MGLREVELNVNFTMRGQHGNSNHLPKSGRRFDTQLGTILDLMLGAAARGNWLTLAEIAQPTVFGEASISAQLRHLRKPRHGRYRVEKRRRRSDETAAGATAPLWEYQVLPPCAGGPDAEACH
jgi:hypothetical protein